MLSQLGGNVSLFSNTIIIYIQCNETSELLLKLHFNMIKITNSSNSLPLKYHRLHKHNISVLDLGHKIEDLSNFLTQDTASKNNNSFRIYIKNEKTFFAHVCYVHNPYPAGTKSD